MSLPSDLLESRELPESLGRTRTLSLSLSSIRVLARARAGHGFSFHDMRLKSLVVGRMTNKTGMQVMRRLNRNSDLVMLKELERFLAQCFKEIMKL